jgi:hypothetical protein
VHGSRAPTVFAGIHRQSRCSPYDEETTASQEGEEGDEDGLDTDMVDVETSALSRPRRRVVEALDGERSRIYAYATHGRS